MRLLNVETYRLEEYFEPNVPPYAILSHRWEQEEVLYGDIDTTACRNKTGWTKVQLTCDQARKDHLAYVWIDTCCIDKNSSAELSEAINSMFRWYRNSSTCYAYLSDVVCPDALSTNDPIAWFDRGWTLQELIAPQCVVFYTQTWMEMGTRNQLSSQISRKTRVPEIILSRIGDIEEILPRFCAAQKMSWAAGRKTMRIEDRAYSLLGLFGLSMPLLYGEGSQAFARLQEEILKTSTDLSILAWSQKSVQHQKFLDNLLAESPDNFQGCENIVDAFPSPYIATGDTAFVITNKGLHIDHPPIVFSWACGERRLALSLGCRRSDDKPGVLALKIHFPTPNTPGDKTPASKRPTCYLGWLSDEPGLDERMICARFLDPTSIHIWQAIVIPKQRASRTPRCPPPMKDPHDYLWVLLPDADKVSWEVLDVWPPRGTGVWDLQTTACYLGSVTDRSFKLAAIAVGNELGESLAVYLKYNSDTIEFSLSDFDPKLFPADKDLKYDFFVDRLDLSWARRMRIERHDLERLGFIICQLKLEIESDKKLFMNYSKHAAARRAFQSMEMIEI